MMPVRLKNVVGFWVAMCCVVATPAALMAGKPRVLIESASMTIESDEALVDTRTGQRTYSGNAKVEHLNFHLRADRIVELREAGQIESVTARGTPVRFRQDAPFTESLSHGVAKRAHYVAATRTLKLWDYRVTDIDGNVTTGKRITYLLR